MKIGIVFPGQGSQSLGMLSDLASEFPEVQAIFSDASAILGYDLWRLIQEGPIDVLNNTMYTQPALLVASYAIWCILCNKKNIKPFLLAGHSLGEYTALLCANAIDFPDAVKLVAARGQYMQEASPIGEGAMAALIGLDEASVRLICEKAKLADEVLSPANFNSPEQIVIAGHMQAVQRAVILAKGAGAKLAKLLPVSVPSHCALMKPAANRLAVFLDTMTITKPDACVLNNVDVMAYDSPDAIREGLIRQLFMPVRWVETIQKMVEAGVSHIIECGPGRVLSGLNKRINSQIRLDTTMDLANLQSF